MKNVIRQLVPYLIAGMILIASNLAFFAPQLSGKVLQQTDMINNTGMAHEAKAYYEKTGKATYWTNSMFGGMPTYQIYNAGKKNSLFDYMVSYFNLTIDGPLGYFLILSLASFLGLCCMRMGPWLSLIGAFSIAFASNHIGLVSAGHLTKIATLGFVPMIIAGTYLIFHQYLKSGFLVFTFGLASCIRMNHIQMTYYVAMILAFYVVAEIIVQIREKKIASLIRAGQALALGVVIAFFVNFSMLLGLNSYAKDTMRGGSILTISDEPQSNNTAPNNKNGLEWDYAMQWSNGFADLLSTIVPGAVGGSNSEEWSKTSKIANLLRKGGVTIPKNFDLPLYWGDLPFTSGPDYLGILMAFLFIMGLVIIKGPFKWFALFSAVFLLLQSMGKHFEVLNHMLFTYFPYYNKFRTPNSILNVLSTVVPVFGVYSLHQFLQQTWNKESLKKLFYKTALPLAGLLLVLILIGPYLFDFKSPRGDTSWESNNIMYTALLDTRASYLKSDAFRSLVILLIGSGLLYFLALKKLTLNYFLIGFCSLLFFDLFTVAKRYVRVDDFHPKKVDVTNFKPRPVDETILQDTDLSYRVFDLSIDPFNSAIPSYFHKMIGGYSPAKLRRYQDMIDFYFSKGNMNALNMMNTKYIINQKGALQTNPTALGNAWFVSQIKKVNSPDEEIKAIDFINPGEEAIFLQSEFNNINLADPYQKNGTIKLIQYSPDRLFYESSSTSDQVAVFSEVWYGPDKGWTATIDGKPAEHFRVNYILRAMNIPSGDHKIEFTFNPKPIIRNENISFYTGMAFGILMLFGLIMAIRDIIRQQVPEIPSPIVTEKINSNPATRPKSQKK